MADRRSGAAAGLVACVVLGLSLVACGGPSPSGTTTGAIGSPATTGAATTTGAPPTTAVPASPSAPSSATAGAPSSAASPLPLVAADDGLLAVLPAAVDGVALRPSPEAVAEMTGDPNLARSAAAIAVGIAVGAGDSAGSDLVVATVVRLRPGIWDDAFFVDWRASYDEAACAPAGGVGGTGQKVVGSRTVDVADCVGGARTYHAHLAGDLLVSVTAVGERGYGDLVMAGLRE